MSTTREAGFIDLWDRSDGPLGNGWRSASEDNARWWDPMELRAGAPVNTNPDHGPIAQPNNAAGRAAAYQDFGEHYADDFRVGAGWNGKHHAVGGPVVCINTENADWGLAFVYEPQLYGGLYVLWALGRQPHQVRVVQTAPGGDHADGTPAYFEIQVRGGTVACFADGKEKLTAAIPAGLVGATRHGFCLDVNPVPGRPPNVEVISGPFRIAPQRKALAKESPVL